MKLVASTLLLIVTHFANVGLAQNLIQNPSFENFSTCPTSSDQLNRANNWQKITGRSDTPDYYNACNGGIAGVPSNQAGNQAANTGDAYIGLVLYTSTSPDYREYAHTNLSAPMIAGQEYCVSFWVSTGDISAVNYTDAIGVYFANGTPPTGPGPVFSKAITSITPQYVHAPAVSEKNNWVQVSFIYTAAGGEDYMLLGNFDNDAAITLITDPSGSVNLYYVYFDDVSIVPHNLPTVSPSGPYCSSDPALNLTVDTTGGSWSGTGIIDATNGTFDPAVAGAGTHTITYSLTGACPSFHSESIVVTDCSLPVELLNFNAVADGPDRVRLSWTTITEIDNDYFVIERSPDAMNFTPIQTVDGAGNTTQQQNYVDFDEDPYRGINYYRLRQVDFDGTTDYSDIRSVVFDDLTFVNLFPNPTDNEINATVMLDQDDDLYMQILDATGRVVLQEEYFVLEGMSTIKVDINSLASGVYTFRINTTDENHLSKEFIRN